MADNQPGLAPSPPDAPGLTRYRQAISAGFTQTEADDWKAKKSAEQAMAGFSRQEIDSYWGDHKTAPGLTTLMAQNADSPHEAANMYESLLAGWQNSVTGLATHGKPTLANPSKSGLVGELANSVGQFVGDLPAAVPGAFAGGTAGGAVGALVPVGGETGVTEAIGATAGAGFGFNAVPQGVREALLAAYNHGQIHEAADAWKVASQAALNTVKAGTVGAATNLVGGPAAKVAEKLGAGALTQTGVRLGAEAATATTTGAVLDGHMPDAHDFTAAAVLMVGLHGVASGAGKIVNGKYRPSQAESRVSSNLQNIYRETGIPPWQAAKMAASDPVLHQEMMGQDTSGQPSTTKFKSQAGVDPAPYPKAPKSTTAGESEKPATVETLMGLVRGLENSAGYAKAHGVSPNEVVSPKGAIGIHQIMPGTARQYGFDPSHLMDPQYNETVARTVLTDLNRRYNGDTAAVLVAYNAGPGRAAKFLAAGRDPSVLPLETQKYLEHAEHMGLTMNGPYRPNWQAFKNTPGRVLRENKDGSYTPDPAAISDYMQEFGRLAGFRFSIGKGSKNADAASNDIYYRRQSADKAVRLPDNSDDAFKRWFGLGRYEVLYHEVGHAIADHFGAINPTGLSDVPGLREELVASSKAWKPKIWDIAPQHANKPAELFADAIARWIGEPSARDQLPIFGKLHGPWLKPFADIAAKSLPVKGDGGEWQDPKGNAGGGGWYSADGGGSGKPPKPPNGGTGGPSQPALPGPGGRIELKFDTRAERFQSDMVGEEKHNGYGLGDAVRQYVSELRPAELIDNMLREQGRLGPKDMGLADMFRQTYGSEGRAISMLRDGPLSLKDPLNISRIEGAKSYMDVLADVQKGGGTLEGFDYWRSAKRTVQLDARGIKGVMPIEEAQKTMADAPKVYAEADKDLQKFQRSILEYGRDSGIFSQKQIEAMQTAGPSYVSFRRVMGDDKSFIGGRGGRSFRVGRSVFKIEGSDRQIISPLLTDIDNVRLITRMADRNRAVRSSIGPLSKPGGGLPALIKRDRVIEIADPGSDVFKPYNLDATEEKAFVPMTAVKSEAGGKNSFVLFEDGKPVRYVAESEGLAELMRGADSAPEAHIIDKVFTGFGKLLRLGVVTLPDFVLRIGLRHEMTAYTYDPLHPPPLVNGVSGAMDIFGKGKEFREWAANGGAGSTFAEMGETTLKDAVFKMFNDSSFTNRAWNVFGSPMQMATALGELMQSMNRVGYFSRAKGMGYEPIKAATMSRTAYLDYAQRGTNSFVNTWSKWTPFLRAHVLGTEMIAKAYANDPLGTVGRLVLSHSIPAVALYVLNYFQDESGHVPEAQQFRNLPRWEKDTYFITPQINGTRLRIPYGFQSGALWGGMVNRFLDSEYQKDPHAFDGWARSFANEYIPPAVPDLIHPAAEIGMNQNFYSGKPLIPDSMKDASGPYQFTDATSEPAKALSKYISPVVNVSPIHIDELVRGWSGTLGQDALRAGDTVMGHAGMPWELSDIPFVQSFVVRNRGSNPQVIEDFYTDLDKVKEKNANFSLSEKRGDYASMMTMANGRSFYKLSEISRALGVQHQLIRGIETNPKMSDDEKRQNIDSLYTMMVHEAKDGSNTIQTLGLAK